MSFALVINSFTAAGFVTGFVNQSLIAFYFGASHGFDAFNMALAVPFFFTSALTSTCYVLIIPYLSLVKHQNEADLCSSRASLIVLFSVIFSVTTLALLIIAQPVVRIAYMAAPEQTRRLALGIVIAVAPSHFFSGLASVVSAVHNQERRFFLTSLAAFSVSLVTLAALSSAGTLGLKSLVLAANAGPLCQLLILLAPLAKDLPAADLKICRKQFDHFASHGTFLLISQFFGQSSQPVIRALSSMLPPGSVSYFAYGDRLFSAFSAFFSQTFATVVLPALSDVAARGHEQLQQHYSRVCRLSLFIAAPVVALWVLLASDVVAILYERGRFSSADGLTVVRILRLYWMQVYLSMAAAPLAPVLYSTGRGDVAGRLWIFVGVLHVLVGYALTRVFALDGLAISYGVVWLVAAVVVLYVINRQLALRPDKELCIVFTQSVLAAFASVLAAIGVSMATAAWLPTGALGHILRLGQTSAAVLGAYASVMWILGSRELSYLVSGMWDAFGQANRR